MFPTQAGGLSLCRCPWHSTEPCPQRPFPACGSAPPPRANPAGTRLGDTRPWGFCSQETRVWGFCLWGSRRPPARSPQRPRAVPAAAEPPGAAVPGLWAPPGHTPGLGARCRARSGRLRHPAPAAGVPIAPWGCPPDPYRTHTRPVPPPPPLPRPLGIPRTSPVPPDPDRATPGRQHLHPPRPPAPPEGAAGGPGLVTHRAPATRPAELAPPPALSAR